MNCQNYQGLFSAYLDRELPLRERAEVAIHALQCAACQADLRSLLEVKILLRAQPLSVMPEAVRARIESVTFGKTPGWKRVFMSRWWVPPLVLAAALGAWLVLHLHKAPAPGVPLDVLVAEHRQYELGVPLAKRERVAWHRAADMKSSERQQ